MRPWQRAPSDHATEFCSLAVLPPWVPAEVRAPFPSAKRRGSFPQDGQRNHSNDLFSISTHFDLDFWAASIGSSAATLDLCFIHCMAWGVVKECHKLIKLKPMICHMLNIQLDTTIRRKFASTILRLLLCECVSQNLDFISHFIDF